MILIIFAFIKDKLELYCSGEWGGVLHKNLKERHRKGAAFLINANWNPRTRRALAM